jgi:hypothetical protein
MASARLNVHQSRKSATTLITARWGCKKEPPFFFRAVVLAFNKERQSRLRMPAANL